MRPLNEEYINLFSYLTKSSIDIEAKQNIKEQIKDEIKYKTAPTSIKRNLKEKAAPEVRTTPIIGDILNVKQYIDLFNKFKKKRKK